MKMKILSSFLNTIVKTIFNRSFLVFGLLFLSVSLGGVFGQVTVSITAVQPNADEEGPVNGSYQVLVDGDNFSFYDVFLSIDGASTADVGDDFSGLPSSVRIFTNGGGSGTALVGVSVIDDNIIENTETVVWSIDLNGGYMINPGNSSAIVNIVDNDVAGVNVTAISGNTGEDGTTAFFTVTLDSQPSAPVTVALTSSNTAEGTVANNVTIPVANWQTGISVTVTGVDDAIVDGDITYSIITGNVTSPDGNYNALGGIAVADVSVTNVDNDVATLTIGDVSEIEGSSMQFMVTLNTAVANPFDVIVTFQNGTAQGGAIPLIVPEDFNNTQQTLNFNGTVNETRQFNVSVLNDDIIETNETFTVVLSASNPLVVDSDTALGTITNNDVGSVTVEADRATTNEDGTGSDGRFQILLSEPNNTGSDIVVTYTLTGSAIQGAGQDYVLSGTVGSVTFGNNQDVKNINVTPNDDSTVEGNETVVLNLQTVSGNAYEVGVPNLATVTIADDDTYIATISATDNGAAETNTGANNGTFTITLNQQNNSGSGVVINYVITGSAVNGVDYTTIGSSVTILNNQQSIPISIAPINDQIQEGAEQVTLTIQASPNYDLGATATRSASVNIVDNDQATLTVSNVTVNEDLVGGQLVFNVVLDIAVSGGTTMSYSFIDDTATGGGTDYTSTAGTLTFTGTANETRPINVPIINDQLLENSETFSVQLGLPTNNVQLVNSGTAIGTINDDDNCVAAPVLDASVSPIYCVVDTGSAFSANLFDFTTSIAPSGTVLTWSRVSNPLITNSHLTVAEAQDVSTPASYYGFFFDAANNCASGNIEVQIVRNIIPEILSITGNERCGPGTLLLGVVPSDGASVNWYDSLDAVTPIAFGETYTTPSLNATATYYVEATENECTTERQPVIARIGFQATTGTAQNGSICNVTANGLTSIDLDTRLTGADPGVWVFVSGPETNINVSSTNVVEFEGITSGAYIFRFTTTNSTAPCVNPMVEVTINVSDCESDDDNDGLLGGQEVALGLDPNNPDTDGDGIEDGVEVGPDIANPLDEDSDGIIDALDSNTEDTDNDGVNDQQDPANNNPCIPNRFNGFCDTDGDGLSDLDEQTNGSDPDDPCDPVATPNCDDPIDLEVLKSVDNEDAQIGDTVVFEITVTNLSDRTARAIVVADLLELGFDFVSKSSLDYDEVSGMWNIAELEAGLSTVLTITVTVSEEGPYENTATLLESIPSDGNTANDESTVTLNTEVPEGIDLEIIKTVDNKTPLLGEQITFTIRVENKSVNEDTISNIQIEDLLPVGPNAGFIYISNVSTAGDFNETTGRWIIESLEVGEQNAVTLEITVSVPIEGTFSNIATLIRSSPTDSNEANNSSTVDVKVSIPTPADPGFLFNQFSPNGDNTNDILRINLRDSETQAREGINYKIVIYDRYGNLVFEGANLVTSETQTTVDVWDGTYKGKEVPKGTYFYIMNYSINNEPAILDKGWIQLIR